MKKCWMLLPILILLTGCGAEDTFETVGDVPAEAPVMAAAGTVCVALPEDAAPVLQNEQQKIYQCGDTEIMLDTFSSGDLQKTIRLLCGFDREALTILRTRQGMAHRYEFVWASMTEAGERLGRAVILDDGNCHYCLSVLRDAEESMEVWDPLFSSFCIA